MLVFLVPALGGALFGYDIGATAFVVQQLQSADYSGRSSVTDTVARNPILIGVIVAISAVGAFCSSWIVFQLHDVIGRRHELRLGAILYAIGASMAALSGTSLVNIFMPGSTATVAILLLIFGRFIFGCGIGFAMHGVSTSKILELNLFNTRLNILLFSSLCLSCFLFLSQNLQKAPTYIAEMSPHSIRGTLISLKEVAIVLGILFGYGLGYAMSHVVGGWMYQYGASVFIALLDAGLTFFIPESARWLILQGYQDEAQSSLAFVFISDDGVEHALQGMIESEQKGKQEKEKEATANGSGQNSDNGSIFSPMRRAPLIAGVGLIVLQQITGQPSVLSYATVIFRKVGLGGLASVTLAVFKLLATITAAITVERFGRKTLLYIGCSLMLVALLSLVTCLAHNDPMDDVMIDASDMNGFHSMGPRQVATVLAMFVYIGGYQIGFGPIAWLMIGEVFPLSIRGQAVAFSVQINFGLNFVVQLLVPVLISAIGLSSTFGLFSIFTGYSLFFVFRHVPETKGLTLEEIEEQFRQDENDSNSIVDQAEPLIESTPLLA